MTVKPVVVGLKEKQPTALRFAAEMAVAHNVSVRVIHCLDIRSAGDFVSMPHNSWRAAGEAILDDARHVIDALPRTTAEYRLDSGLPFYTLRDESDNATMVVVGIDSAGRKSGLFGGTVTERLAVQSPVPVAIVPEQSWRHDSFGTVVVGVDGRTPARGSLRFAFTEASRRNAELQAVHVVPVDDMFGDTLPHRVGLSEALAGWAEEFPDVKVSRRFLFDDADEGCVRVTDKADLLILGRGPTTAMNQLLGHPVLSEITARAQCPCVVVPDDWKGH